jgi:hypothetical protein
MGASMQTIVIHTVFIFDDDLCLFLRCPERATTLAKSAGEWGLHTEPYAFDHSSMRVSGHSM